MKATPPHLLLTNYAMLEYLLLRPQDSSLFSTTGPVAGGHAADSTWRFVVVDEAHVYDGSQGAEIAMLLRRLRDRVVPDRAIQCIATSATVGGDSDPAAATRFAQDLFGQPFEWVTGDSTRQDLVVAKRVSDPAGPFWGPLTAGDYVGLAAAPDPGAAVLAAARAAGWGGEGDGSAAHALLHERSLATLRSMLAGSPTSYDVAAQAVFGDDPLARPGLTAMVDLGSSLRAGDSTTPISARYHLFLRATEGAFTCLSETGPHVQLARHTECPDCTAPAFEIGSCKRCGAVHVVGTPTIEGGVHRLRPRKSGTRGTWLVLGDQDPVSDEDEDAVVDEADAPAIEAEDARLCPHCGVLAQIGAMACPGCGAGALRAVRKLKQRGEEIAGCLVCGARGSGTVRVFETGADASTAVIATSLYQALPASHDPAEVQRPGQGRKLLAFSDSRQAAAYFAPYLEESYGRLQRRRLIVQGLIGANASEEPAAIEDVVYETRRSAAKAKTFPGSMTSSQQARVVAPWVMAEVLATDDRQSLEGLGLIRLAPYRDPAWIAPSPLLALGLDADEAWALVEELVRSLRQQGAVTMPDEVPPEHDIFLPRLGPIRVRRSGSEAVRKVLSWLPTKGRNRRLDYLSRVLTQLGSTADPTTVLDGIWGYLTNPAAPVDWLRSTTEPGLGTVHQVDHERLRLTWVTDDAPVHICSVCRRVAPTSVRDICPALGCEGLLRPFVPPSVADDRDHYRAIYRSMFPVPLTAQEHTAQWKNTEAARIQQEFLRGQVNTLSCSTTFELGVDVGELQAVLLRNMPPRTANYLQRAGRAGRRSGAAALVVTYATRRSHDLTKFAEPKQMIVGEVRAPYVPLTNARIDRRHAHSVAMAAFFRWLFDGSARIDRKAGEFFLPVDGNHPSVGLVAGYLDPVPTDLTAALTRILPDAVAAEIDIAGGAWARELVDLLETVRVELASEVDVLDQLQQDAAASANYQLAERYRKVGATLRTRDLLGFLANRNVLPKYGFPVDSVELRTDFGYGNNKGGVLDLSRDLSQAIHEYAPDASIVAGGSLWTSRGIYRLPGRNLVEYEYHVCKRCGGFRHAVAGVDPVCPRCGEVAQTGPRKVTKPEFGFVAAREPEKPGPRPPQRSWSGAVHVLAKPPEATSYTTSLVGGSIVVEVGPRGRMIAVADGPAAMGYWVCDWCGHGAARALSPSKPPAKHQNTLTHRPCAGPHRLLDLCHDYETDLLTLHVSVPGFHGSQAAWKSVLYAVVEAASDALEIARDDIGGSLTPIGADDWSLSLFDTVSGGAGHVLRIEEHLDLVLAAALRRVSACECGSETSCYGCLRSYGNQRDHDDLSRSAAEQILSRLMAGVGPIDAAHTVEAASDTSPVVTAPGLDFA